MIIETEPFAYFDLYDQPLPTGPLFTGTHTFDYSVYEGQSGYNKVSWTIGPEVSGGAIRQGQHELGRPGGPPGRRNPTTDNAEARGANRRRCSLTRAQAALSGFSRQTRSPPAHASPGTGRRRWAAPLAAFPRHGSRMAQKRAAGSMLVHTTPGSPPRTSTALAAGSDAWRKEGPHAPPFRTLGTRPRHCARPRGAFPVGPAPHAIATQAATPAAASPVPDRGDFAGLVDIGGGRRMFLQCRGHDGPTVVLLSGGGNTGGAWTVLPDEVAPRPSCPGWPPSPASAPTTARAPHSMPIPLTTAAVATPSLSPPPPRTWSPTCTPS